MAKILETRDLTYVYGAGTPFERTAIDDINFFVETDELLGIIGHTGSGKSTLIQHLNGLLKPNLGKVLLSGKNIWSTQTKIRDVRFKVGLVFQYPEYQLFEETIALDIAFGPKNMGLSQKEIDRRVSEAMLFVGLDEELKNESPFELSGGQKRRAAIAGVIAMEPDVLILDEPTAGLDPAGRDALLNRIIKYKKEKHNSVVIVSHSMEDIAKIADRLYVLNDGKIMLTGTPAEVFSHGEELQASGLNVPQITRVFMELRNRGIELPLSIYTVENAVSALEKYKEGRKNA